MRRGRCLSHHGIAVGPSEVPLEHLVVEAEPLVVAAQTCGRQRGGRVSSSSPEWTRLLRIYVGVLETQTQTGTRCYAYGNSPCEGLFDLPGVN